MGRAALALFDVRPSGPASHRRYGRVPVQDIRARGWGAYERCRVEAPLC